MRAPLQPLLHCSAKAALRFTQVVSKLQIRTNLVKGKQRIAPCPVFSSRTPLPGRALSIPYPNLQNLLPCKERRGLRRMAHKDAVQDCSVKMGSNESLVQRHRFLCVLDFEATCDQGGNFSPQEVIEFPVVVVDSSEMRVVHIFHHFCEPQVHPELTPFCKELTGITQEQVDAGKSLAEVLSLLDQFLLERGLIPASSVAASGTSSPKHASASSSNQSLGHVAAPGTSPNSSPLLFVTCGDWDLKTMLPNQAAISNVAIPSYLRTWCNIKKLFGVFYSLKRSPLGMPGLLDHLGLQMEGRHHSGIDDSRNIARVAIHMLQAGCNFAATAGEGAVANAELRSVVGTFEGPTTPQTAEAPGPEPGWEAGSAQGWSGPPKMVDIGVNLSHRSFQRHVSDVLKRAAEGGVAEIIVTGLSVKESRNAVDLCKARDGEHGVRLRCTVGVHPHEATRAVAAGLQQCVSDLERLCRENSDCVVAVGECGLDFDRNFSTPEDQVAVFRAQVQLAKRLGLPMFLHERRAHLELLEILQEEWSTPRGVVHCFTGTREKMLRCLELGLHIGVTGWICDERRNASLLEAVKELPLARLLLETDAPFLIPRTVPKKEVKKFKNQNEPCLLLWVARGVAESMGLSVDEVVEASASNSQSLFGPKDAS